MTVVNYEKGCLTYYSTSRVNAQYCREGNSEGKNKNPKMQKSKRCEIVKKIEKLKYKEIYAVLENNICKQKILFSFI